MLKIKSQTLGVNDTLQTKEILDHSVLDVKKGFVQLGWVSFVSLGKSGFLVFILG